MAKRPQKQDSVLKLSSLESTLEEKYIPLEAKKRRLGAAGIVLVISAAIGYFMIYSDFQAYQRTSKKLESTTTKLETAKRDASLFKDIDADSRTLQAKFQRATQLIPETRDVDHVIKQISDRGVDAGLTLTRVDPETKEVEKNYYNEIPLQIEATGTYSGIGTFLSSLTSMKRFIGAPKVEIFKAYRENEEIVNHARISLVLYRFTNKKFLTKEERKLLETEAKAKKAAAKKAKRAAAKKS